MKLKFVQMTLAIAAIATLATGCGGGGHKSHGGHGGGGGGPIIVDPVYPAWYNVYGVYCASGDPQPGCNFYANGLKVIDLEDPYFVNSYVLQYDTWSYYDSYGYAQVYTGWVWNSPTGIIYDEFGNALNNTDGQGRDFAGDVGKAERNVVAKAGEFFAAKYHLSSEVGVKVARALNDWANVGKKRARTEADIAAFTNRVYGVDFNKLTGALEEAMTGNKANLEAVIQDSAQNWSTTPETLKEILKDWYGNQINLIL